MRHSLRTLLIIVLPVAVGCAPAPIGEPSANAPTLRIARAVASTEPKELEWADLAFTINDRESFDVDQLPATVRALDGKEVRLRGYFHLAASRSKVQEFLLLGEINTKPIAVKLGTPPDELPIHQIAAVEMSAGRTARFSLEPVAVTGTLFFEVVKWDGKAFLVFRVVADSVEPVMKRPGYWPALSGGC